MDVKLRRGQKEFKCPKCKTDLHIKHAHFQSTAKGSSLETYVAQEMSQALYGRDGVLRRTPTSGAMETFWPYDIFPAKVGTDGFPFAVECKFRETWDFGDILQGKTSRPTKTKRKADRHILDWWRTLESDIQKNKKEFGLKIPVLVIKKSRLKPYAIVPPKFAHKAGIRNYLGNEELCVMLFNDFLTVLKENRHKFGGSG